MRKIKFKLWDDKEKEMLECFDVDSFCSDAFPYHLDRLVKLQYTGLKDKNGKEIYYGDIIQCGSEKGFNWYVSDEFYYPTLCECKGDLCQSDVMGNFPETYEIIGNIYENKNLVKKDLIKKQDEELKYILKDFGRLLRKDEREAKIEYLLEIISKFRKEIVEYERKRLNKLNK